jgi:hypothetical protein
MPAHVDWRPAAVGQVLINYANNAIKFGPS